MNSPEGREAPVSITTLTLPSPLDEQPRGKGGSSLYHHAYPPQPLDEQPRGKEGSSLYHYAYPSQPSG
ncbi:hypothetical protein ACOMHN_020661 [Nucella lapillus]